MRMGTRWAAGTTPPTAVPAVLRDAITAADASLPEGTRASWTLTFLEDRAIAELDAGVEVAENADGTVSVEHF